MRFKPTFLGILLAISPTAVLGEISVATWNLGGFHPLDRSQVPSFVEVIEKAGYPDVLLLVEVNDFWIASEIAADLMHDQDRCYRRWIPEQPTAPQEIALLHSCDIKLDEVGLVPGSDLGLRYYRQAIFANLTAGNFDFLLVGVHLKAGRGTDDRAKRNEQAAILRNFIEEKTAGVEKDVLLIGDYNMIPGADFETFEVLSPNGELRFMSSTDLADDFTHISRNGSPGNLLDGFAVASEFTTEYIENSINIVPAHELLGMTLGEYSENVTDHLPVSARFRNNGPDDD